MELNRFVIQLVLLSCVFLSVRTDENCSIDNCYATTGYICNNQGSCDCGTCQCEAPYSGPTCEECPTCPTPCELFKGCVGCKVFSTGLMSIMECLSTCDYIANYIGVQPEQFDTEEDSDRLLCKHTNRDMCVESFRIGEMTAGYRDLYVRTDLECLPIDLPTLPPYVPVETTYMDETTETPETTTEYMTSFTTTTLREIITPSTAIKSPSTEKQPLTTSTSPVMSTIQTTTESVPDLSDSKEIKPDDVHDNNSDSDSESSDSDVEHIVVEIEVDNQDNTDDTLPEEAGPVSGQNNPSSDGNKGTDNNTASLILTILCSIYYCVRLH